MCTISFILLQYNFVYLTSILIPLYALAKTTSDNLTCLDNVYIAYDMVENKMTTLTQANISYLGNIAYSTVSNTQEPTAKAPTSHTALYENNTVHLNTQHLVKS